MTNKIPDFTESELRVVTAALKERYGEEVESQLADAEMQIDNDSDERVECPVIFWHKQSASFMVYKLGQKRYSARYFYTLASSFAQQRKIMTKLVIACLPFSWCRQITRHRRQAAFSV